MFAAQVWCTPASGTKNAVGRRIRSSRPSETRSKAKQNEEENSNKINKGGENSTQNKTKQNHHTIRQLMLMLRPLIAFQRPELQVRGRTGSSFTSGGILQAAFPLAAAAGIQRLAGWRLGLCGRESGGNLSHPSRHHGEKARAGCRALGGAERGGSWRRPWAGAEPSRPWRRRSGWKPLHPSAKGLDVP